MDTRIELKADVNLSSASNFYTGFSNNLGTGGIFIATLAVTYKDLPVGSLVDLEFSLPDGGNPIKVKGEVRWIREHNPKSDLEGGVGLRFVKISDEDSKRIKTFVEFRETLFWDDDHE